MGFPDAFTEEMKELLGGEYAAWLACMEEGGERAARGLRVNRLKIGAEEFRARCPFALRPVSWTENGFYLEGTERVSRHPWYAAGLCYLQEPSAMTPAAILPVEERDRVLDLCAAPGGKATELAGRLGGTGLLVANDISNSRAKALLKNLELCGAEHILVTSESPERLLQFFEGYFDKLLIDAPCSGEGMFRKDPAMIRDWTEKGPQYYSALQKEITAQAARLLRPGGLLLYSTCTFSVRENEETILSLLRSDPGFEVLPAKLPVREGLPLPDFAPGRPDLVNGPVTEEEARQLRLTLRLYPHRIEGEGHFAALLRKKSREGEAESRIPAASRETGGRLPKAWTEFAGLLHRSFEESRIRLYDGRLYYLPEELSGRSIRGLRFLRTGLLLGEIRKERFEPSQALAMALRREDCKVVLNLSSEDDRTLRYLKGETIDTDEDENCAGRKGWCLVCVDGFPLGWGKLANGRLKNKYYSGWRWQ